MPEQNKEESFSSFPSPVIQTTTSLFCWSTALVGTFSAPRDDASLSTNGVSFRERFFLPLLPCSIIIWTLIYIMMCNTIKRDCRPTSLKSIAGYPGWSYMVGVCHGLIFLPCMFALSVIAHIYETGGSSESFLATSLVSDVSTFWHGSWGSATLASHHLLEQIHCAVIGYMLKDFVVYPGGLETGYILHHIFAVVGCTLCLWFPSVAGIITFQAMQCEFASALFSVHTLYPTRFGQLTYFLTMPASNIGAAWLAWYVCYEWIELASLPYRILYGVLTVLLLLIRSIGVVLEAMKLCAAEKKAKKD